jgi:hypothetical protein
VAADKGENPNRALGLRRRPIGSSCRGTLGLDWARTPRIWLAELGAHEGDTVAAIVRCGTRVWGAEQSGRGGKGHAGDYAPLSRSEAKQHGAEQVSEPGRGAGAWTAVVGR